MKLIPFIIVFWFTVVALVSQGYNAYLLQKQTEQIDSQQNAVDAMVETLSVTQVEEPLTPTEDINLITPILPDPTETPFMPIVTNEPIPTLSFKEMLGNPRVSEKFEKGSQGFGLSDGLNDDQYLRAVIENNTLTLTPKMSNGWRSWLLRPPVIGDSIASVDFRTLNCAPGDEFGLILRADNYDNGNGYYFGFDCQGIIKVYSGINLLSSVDASALLRKEAYRPEHLEAQAFGNKLTVSLNDTPAIEIVDDTFKSGYSGFYTAPHSADTLTVQVTEFDLYY